MKFAHIADLHIGKKLGAFDLIEDQRFALNAIIDAISDIRPDAVFVAGDIYDRAVPSAEAITLADEFITRLAALARVFIVGGNHDSQPRLGFGSRIMRAQGVYISRDYAGDMEKYAIEDEFGEIDIYLMPYVRPREVEIYFKDEAPNGFECAEDAVRAIIKRAADAENARRARDPAPRRSVLITHQFVTCVGARLTTSESEINPIGGLSCVDVSAFDAFDYVALGHLHAPQQVGGARVRYAGSPLKYSFSETRHKKSFVIGDMDAMGNVSITLTPIPCLRDLRLLEGPAEKLIAHAENTEDYVSIRITGAPPAAPMDYMSAAYKNIVRLELMAISEAKLADGTASADKPPIERFRDFFALATGEELTGDMLAAAIEAMDDAIEETNA